LSCARVSEISDGECMNNTLDRYINESKLAVGSTFESVGYDFLDKKFNWCLLNYSSASEEYWT